MSHSPHTQFLTSNAQGKVTSPAEAFYAHWNVTMILFDLLKYCIHIGVGGRQWVDFEELLIPWIFIDIISMVEVRDQHQISWSHKQLLLQF